MRIDPLVSVITVTFNCVETIQATIDSVADQSYSNIEHIVVDGNSTDGTVTIIQQNAGKLTHWLSETDRGIYDAMNKGLNLASIESRYTLFLNSGDVFSDEMVVRDVVGFGQNKKTSIYGNIRKGGCLLVTPGKVGWSALSTDMICHQAIFFVTDDHRKINYDISYELCADYKLLLEMISAGHRFAKIDRIVVNFDATGISSTKRGTLHRERAKIRRSFPLARMLSYIKPRVKVVKSLLKNDGKLQ